VHSKSIFYGAGWASLPQPGVELKSRQVHFLTNHCKNLKVLTAMLFDSSMQNLAFPHNMQNSLLKLNCFYFEGM
jgi:hypothetical protein